MSLDWGPTPLVRISVSPDVQATAAVCTLAAVVGAALFVVAFALFAATCAPAISWLDSAEFVAAAASLGVPHSPGHPLEAMLGRAITLVPVGDVAFRVNLLSALLTASAVPVLYRALRRLLRALAPGAAHWTHEAVAAAVALTFACSAAVWMQAVRAEVYGLELLLLAAMVDAVVGYAMTRRPTYALRFALATGLGLATHHFITLTLALPAGIAMVWMARPALATVTSSLAAGTVGLMAFAYLPVRAAAEPVLNWGHPDSLGRLLWTISGRAFTKTMSAEHTSGTTTDVLQIVAAVVASSPLLPLLALLGAYLSVRLGRGRKLTALAASVVALTIVGRAMLGFDPETPDHYAYLMPAFLGLAILAVLGLALLLDTARTMQAATAGLACASLAGLLLTTGPSTYADSDSSGAYGADEIARKTVDSIPVGGVALTSYFQTAFRVAALVASEGARPDVAFIDRSFLSYPGERVAAKARHPELATLIDAGLEPGEPAPLPELGKVAAVRPLSIELHFNLDPSYHAHLAADGPFARFDAPPSSRSASYLGDLESLREATGGSDRVWTTMHLLWTDYVHLVHACERGERAAAQALLDRAFALAPADTTLRELGAGCGLLLPAP